MAVPSVKFTKVTVVQEVLFIESNAIGEDLVTKQEVAIKLVIHTCFRLEEKHIV